MKSDGGPGVLSLAPGVEFFEQSHEYYYKGRKLSGVTGLIAQKLRLRLPEEFVAEHQAEGLHIHRAVSRWIETGESGSVHPGVEWTISRLIGRRERLHSETLVTDFKRYASSVDVIDDLGDGTLDLCDIKKGLFKREYCAWQLSIYKYLIERHTAFTVRKCAALCVKDRESYPIFAKPAAEVEKLLYGAAP